MFMAKIIVASLTFASAAVYAEPMEDRFALLFSGITANGATINLADLRGKAALAAVAEGNKVAKPYGCDGNIQTRS